MPRVAANATSEQASAQRAKRARVFVLTWLAYVTYYLARNNYSVCKTTLSTNFGLTPENLADIETVYLIAYAIGQFVSGGVGDRIGARRLLSIGMLMAALASAAFGLSSVGLLFGAAYAVNGLFQATGWPGNLKAMANWFGTQRRGFVMGAWTTSYTVGPFVAPLLAGWLLSHVSWRAAFFVPAAALTTMGLAIWFFLPEPGGEAIGAGADGRAPKSYRVLREPALWSIGSAYFCLKLIRYSIFFWHPWYLEKVLHYSRATATYVSTSFAVGGVAGSVVVGLISDQWFRERRRQLASGMVVLLGGALLLYPRIATMGIAINFLGMALVGFCLYGPDALISGAAAQDLGGADATALAAGTINGMGSIGSVFQGRFTAMVSRDYGWNALFYSFVGMALFAAAVLRFVQPQPKNPVRAG
jgi:OPA family sugar phosphate sensor protein UhpC-like MFS transporter